MDRITITNVDIPFGRIVELVLLWCLATIPAMIILGIIGCVLVLLHRGLVGYTAELPSVSMRCA